MDQCNGHADTVLGLGQQYKWPDKLLIARTRFNEIHDEIGIHNFLLHSMDRGTVEPYATTTSVDLSKILGETNILGEQKLVITYESMCVSQLLGARTQAATKSLLLWPQPYM